MLNLLQKYLNRSQTQAASKAAYAEHFLSRPEHDWIKAHPGTKQCFEKLFTLLPHNLVASMIRQPFCFVPAAEFKANGPVRYQLKNTVVVFPEFEALLRQGSGEGVAFLAHEVALVLYEIESIEDKDPIMAEVEADKFVCDLGLADDLERLLLTLDESAEKRLRLTYLTFNAFGIN